MADWARVPDDELDDVRAQKESGKVEMMWSDGWWSRPRSLGVKGSAPVRPTSDPLTIDELREVKTPLARNSEGRYVTHYQECVCGEQYLVKSDHEATSPRHKQWKRGEIEVPVPSQPLMSAFPIDDPTPPLELGKVVICGTCKAKKPKMEDCKRCNGHGVVPNVGPMASRSGR